MTNPPGSEMLRLEEDLRAVIRLTLDHGELVRIAQAIADADRTQLDFFAKKDLVRLIRLTVRARESNCGNAPFKMDPPDRIDRLEAYHCCEFLADQKAQLGLAEWDGDMTQLLSTPSFEKRNADDPSEPGLPRKMH